MRFLLVLSVALSACLLASADIVHLKDGRTFEGVVSTRGGTVTIAMRHGKVSFPMSQVARIEKKQTPGQELAARKAKLAADDVDGRLALAAWAKTKKLHAEARALYAEVVKLDPTNDVAHQALGHVYQDGKWLTRAEAMKRAGFVLHKGKWILAEEKALMERRKYLGRARVDRVEVLDGKRARIHLTHPTSAPRAVPAIVEKLDGGSVQLRGDGWPVATSVELAALKPPIVYAVRKRFADPGDAAQRAELARYCERNGMRAEALAEARAAAALDPAHGALARRLAGMGAGSGGEAAPDRGAELDRIKALWKSGKAQRALDALSALLKKGVGEREPEARQLLGRWMAASVGRAALIERLRVVAAALDRTRDRGRLDFIQTLMEYLTPDLTGRTNVLLGERGEGKPTREQALATAARVEVGLVYRDEPSIVRGTEAAGGTNAGDALRFLLPPATVLALEKWVSDYRATFDKRERKTLRRKLPRQYPELKIEQLAAIVRRGKRYPRTIKPGTSVQKYIVAAEGSQTVYHLFVPPGYSPLVAHPLMVYMHSKRGSGEQGLTYLKAVAAKRGWLLCCPTATRNRFKGWGGTEGERSTTLSAIDDLRLKCHVDDARIYLGGAAMGAHGTWSLAMHYPDRVAAIFPVLGAPRIKRYRLLNNLQHVPVFAAQGALDNQYLVMGVRYATSRLSAMGFTAKYREFAHLGHVWPPKVQEEFADWVADIRRPANPERVILRVLADPHTRSHWVELIDFDRDVGTPIQLPATFARLDESTRRLRSIDLYERKVAQVVATIAAPNTIQVKGNRYVKRVRLHFGPGMIDFAKKVKIKYNGKVAFDGYITPSFDYLLETTRRRDDRIGYAAVDIRAP